MSDYDVTVMNALIICVWLCKQDVNKRSYGVHPFVQDRDNKNSSENLILELSSDQENLHSFI
jgi:hypothetical protein